MINACLARQVQLFLKTAALGKPPSLPYKSLYEIAKRKVYVLNGFGWGCHATAGSWGCWWRCLLFVGAWASFVLRFYLYKAPWLAFENRQTGLHCSKVYGAFGSVPSPSLIQTPGHASQARETHFSTVFCRASMRALGLLRQSQSDARFLMPVQRWHRGHLLRGTCMVLRTAWLLGVLTRLTPAPTTCIHAHHVALQISAGTAGCRYKPPSR